MRPYCTPCKKALVLEFGAGDGNRTRIYSLEGYSNSHYTTPARLFVRDKSNQDNDKLQGILICQV